MEKNIKMRSDFLLLFFCKMISLEDIKLPPHNIDAEKWTLCWALMENELLYVYEGFILTPEDFYQKEHQFIYQAIKDLWVARKTVDVLTVSDQLTKNWNLEVVWGSDYLYELSMFLLSTSTCPEYAKIVKEKSVLRNILKVSQHIIWDVYDQKDTMNILESIEKRIFDLTQIKSSDSIKHIKDILNSRIDNYMDIVDHPEKINENKVMAGYRGMDEMLSWFKHWELVILAARPSMWKTAFAINILKNVAIDQKKTVAMFSLEMTADSIVDRIISTVADIPMYRITKWQLDEDDFSKMWQAIEILWETNVFLDDKWWANIPLLKSKLRRLKIEKWWLDLVIIDYLQLMNATTFVWNRVQEISEISRWLKELAMELKVPIIALSQLSREVEKRVDKKPQLSDLRESGAIEQDADSVIMLHREDYYDPDTDKKWLTDVCIRKNRNGAVWEVSLMFQKEIMKFVELSEWKDDWTF